MMGQWFDDPTTPEGLLSALKKRMQRDLVSLVAEHGDQSKSVQDCTKTYEWFAQKLKALS